MTIIFKKKQTEDKVLDMPKFNLNNSGKPVSSPQNVVLILESFESKMTLLGYNEFTGAVEKLDKTPWGTQNGIAKTLLCFWYILINSFTLLLKRIILKMLY